jgi:hypothetical protein
MKNMTKMTTIIKPNLLSKGLGFFMQSPSLVQRGVRGVLIILILIALGNAPAQADITTGLIAHWSFDDGSGTTAVDTCKADNPSCTPNNASLVNAPTWVAGQYPKADTTKGMALSFNGTNQDVTTTFNVGTGLTTGSFTISILVNATVSQFGRYLYSGTDSGNQRFYLKEDASNQLSLGIGSWNPTINGSMTANQWQFYMVVFDASTGTGYIYLNGALLSSSTGVSISMPSKNFIIASDTAKDSNSFFQGTIDDVRIYNRAFMLADVQLLNGPMDTTPPTAPTSLNASGVSETEVDLAWAASTDNVAVVGYKIFRDSGSGLVQVGTTTTPSYKDTGLSLGITYSYQVVAFDQAGNQTASSIVTGKTVKSVCVGTSSRTCTALTCGQQDVQDAINQAQDGDTVVIPPGATATCTWTKTVQVDLATNPRSIKIQGTGVGSTILYDNIDSSLGGGGEQAEGLFNITTAAGKSFRFTALEIEPGARTVEYSGGAAIYINGNSQNVRIDHITVGPILNRAVQVKGAVLGVADHSTFNYTTGGQPFLFVQSGLFGGSWGDGSWENPVDWGGPGAFYVEDNTFNPSSAAWVGCLDGWGGARVVARYNNFNFCGIGYHGTESSQRLRSGRSYEIYNNNFIRSTLSKYNDTFIELRGGSALIHDNTLSAISTNTAIKLETYRRTGEFAPWGIADGTKAWDKPMDSSNTPGAPTNGIFETGTATTVAIAANGQSSSITDSPKAWGLNQWQRYNVRQIINLTASSGGVRTVTVVPNPGWSNNQWAGWEFTKTADNSKTQVVSNTSDTLTFSNSYYALDMTGGGPFVLSLSAYILSNTANTLTLSGTIENVQYHWVINMPYEIRNLDHVLDQPGSGITTPVIGDPPNNQNLNQQIDPIYEWNNTITGVSVGKFGTYNTIKPGRDYFVNTAKSGYVPYQCPHPLITTGFTAGSYPGDLPYCPDSTPAAPGDVDYSGTVTMADAELTAQAALGLVSLNPGQIKAAGVSSSTETKPTIYDAFLIAEYVARLITKFPVQG